MKRFVMTVTILYVLISSTMAFAAEPDTCILLVSSPEMQTEDVIKMVKNAFKDNPNVACSLDIQAKYQEYWFNKGEIEEGPVTPQVMLEFRKFCGYDNCLFLVENSNSDKNIVAVPNYVTGQVFNEQVTRSTVNLKCFLIGQDNLGESKVIKIFSATSSAKSGQGDLKAKKWAFKEAIKSVYKQFIS